MPVDQSEILQKAVNTLRDDAGLLALTGELTPGKARVYNHVPQDESLPYVLVVWQADTDWDTKDSTGFDGSLNHEVVSPHHGDRDVLKMQDAVIAAYTAAPLFLDAGRIVCFDYQAGSVPVNVAQTHRATFSFNILVDDEGIGGAPIPDPLGAKIQVSEDGTQLGLFSELDFGLGVEAEDKGGGVAEIRAQDQPIVLLDAVGADKGKADLAGGHRWFRWNMAEDGQLLPQNVPAAAIPGLGVVIILILEQQAPGGHTLTHPPGTRWNENTPPTLVTTVPGRTFIGYSSDDGGTTWDGFLLSSDSQ